MDVKRIARAIWGTDEEAVLLAADARGGSCSLDDVTQSLGDQRAAISGIQALEKRGLVEEVMMDYGVTLTRDGLQAAAAVTRSRARGLARFDAVQRGILEWLDENGEQKSVDDFVGTDEATAYGTDFTLEEVREQADYLAHEGLIRVFRVNGPELLRPCINPRGRYAVHSDGMIRDYVEGRSVSLHDESRTVTNTVNVSDSTVGAFVQGDNSTIHSVSVVVEASEWAEVRSLVDRALSELGDADEDAPLREVLGEIRAETETAEADRPSMLKKAGSALLIATATEGGRQVVQWLGQMVTLLGG